jgi:hypothetical protein
LLTPGLKFSRENEMIEELKEEDNLSEKEVAKIIIQVAQPAP